jgi:mRNA-degrading endonuclease RelE of RelBE toxin-antitoxin system
MTNRVWEVGFSNKARKQKEKLAVREQELLFKLVVDLINEGPAQYRWPNYSKLESDTYHCHLNRKWVACWKVENDHVKLIEIYYVGSRENAPYAR